MLWLEDLHVKIVARRVYNQLSYTVITNWRLILQPSSEATLELGGLSKNREILEILTKNKKHLAVNK
jgi:hypothetical protein